MNSSLLKFAEKTKAIKWTRLIEVKQPFYIAFIFFESFRDNFYASTGIPFSFKNTRCEHTTWSYVYGPSEVEWKACIDAVQAMRKRAPNTLEHLISRYNSACERFMRKTSEVTKLPLKEFSNRELATAFQDYCVKGEKEIAPFRYVPVLAEETLLPDIQRTLDKIVADREKRLRYLKDLTYVVEGGYVRSEEASLREIVNLLRSRQKEFADADQLEQVIKQDQLIYDAVSRHLQRFAWMNVRNYNGTPMSLQDFLPRLVHEFFYPTQDTFEERKRESEVRFQQAVEDLRLDDRIIEDILLLRKYTVMRTVKRDDVSCGQFNTWPLFEEVAQRLGLRHDELAYLYYKEILESLERGTTLSRLLIRERQEGYAAYMIDGEEFVISGKALEAFKPIHSSIDVEKILRGEPACLGKAVGPVRIVITKDDLAKVQEGDVLVAPVTIPDYVVAMHKCAAIVTDIGGVTCHAAIISRELGKPCVVGTKIATKAFRDGDLVEVDATNGVVKKVK